MSISGHHSIYKIALWGWTSGTGTLKKPPGDFASGFQTPHRETLSQEHPCSPLTFLIPTPSRTAGFLNAFFTGPRT